MQARAPGPHWRLVTGARLSHGSARSSTGPGCWAGDAAKPADAGEIAQAGRLPLPHHEGMNIKISGAVAPRRTAIATLSRGNHDLSCSVLIAVVGREVRMKAVIGEGGAIGDDTRPCNVGAR
jgi:hypothetical protein